MASCGFPSVASLSRSLRFHCGVCHRYTACRIELTCNATFEFCGKFGKTLSVVCERLVPIVFQLRAALLRVPAGIDMIGYFKRREFPADPGACRGDLIFAQGGAVAIRGALFAGRTPTYRRFAAQQARPLVICKGFM